MAIILIHSPVSNRAWCLPGFLDGLTFQNLEPGDEVKYLFDLNDSQDDSRAILDGFARRAASGVKIVEHPWPKIELGDHQWNPERYRRMIYMRNGALDAAGRLGARFLFSVDTDVILSDPDTLRHLISADVPIIAGVFTSTWGNPEAQALPNVWQRGQNEMSDEFLLGIDKSPEHVKVGGLGACTLIRRDVWLANVSYDPIYNLPSNYRGEDRYFCLRAAAAGFEMWACAHKKITHLCR